MSARGTSNTNDRGSSAARRSRKAWLIDNFGDGTHVMCHLCWREVLTIETVTVDRIFPGVLGGRYTRDNIQPASMRCNSLAGTALRERLKRGLCTTGSTIPAT